MILLSLVLISTIIPLNITFTRSIVTSIITFSVQYARVSVPAIILKLSSKSKNFYYTSDNRFFKLCNILKNEIDQWVKQTY